MSSYIEKVYELTNLSILTPSNLLSNIKLDNYKEVKYYKIENTLICEMVSVEENEEVHYRYEFDTKDKLQKAIIVYQSEEMEIFNREKELNELLRKNYGQYKRKLA
ncbi:hypothetical protein [Desemzia sp. FAM 23991]|uniref:hypothetical protein n=1 Tax=unclassified Desemzia TaxID=2685243 RepID=UPI00388A54FE